MSSCHCSILMGQKVTFDSHWVVSALCAFQMSFCSFQLSSWPVCVLELMPRLHLDLWSLRCCFYAHPHHGFYDTLQDHQGYHCSASLELLGPHDLQVASCSSACRWWECYLRPIQYYSSKLVLACDVPCCWTLNQLNSDVESKSFCQMQVASLPKSHLGYHVSLSR